MPKPSKTPTTEFGRWLSQAMKECRCKQMELSESSGMAQSTISSYMSGVRKPRRAIEVEMIAGALHAIHKLHAYVPTEGFAVFVDTALLAAGFAPEHKAYRVIREDTPPYIYEPIIKDIEIAAEAGNLDEEAVRRIRLQIQLETEEVARRKATSLENEEEA